LNWQAACERFKANRTTLDTRYLQAQASGEQQVF
jgi:hypothetical protein